MIYIMRGELICDEEFSVYGPTSTEDIGKVKFIVMAKIKDMTLEERETHLSCTAADREEGLGWDMFTDDPVMIRRMESIGLQAYQVMEGGAKKFRIPFNQLTIRRKRVVSEEQREELSRRAKENFAREKATAPGVEDRE